MALNLQAILNAPLIEVDVIDSTNNYAMSLINADTAQAGLTIVAKTQTKGKGQRGRTWFDAPEQCLLMSIITEPDYNLDDQFAFNAVIALAIVDVLETILENCRIQIKWPNDIIVNDKKAGGVLVENVIRGNSWQYSIVGVGINVLQDPMPIDLPYATSLRAASGKKVQIWDLMNRLRDNINRNAHVYKNSIDIIEKYNSYLYRKDKRQTFIKGDDHFEATIIKAVKDGTLQVEMADRQGIFLKHGEIVWGWGG